MRFQNSVLVAAIFAAACGFRSELVPLEGVQSDLDMVAGTWEGAYETTEGGARRGSIHFEATQGRDSASGYVLMTIERPAPDMSRAATIYSAQPLQHEAVAIRFVRISRNLVRGELASYRDPECGCPLKTVFIGTREGDTIHGVFTTRHSDTNTTYSGNWHAQRQSPKGQSRR